MNQPNEGMRERWNKYCNKYWKGNVTDKGKTKIVLEVDEDFGYYILDSEIDLALAKQRSEIRDTAIMVQNLDQDTDYFYIGVCKEDIPDIFYVIPAFDEDYETLEILPILDSHINKLSTE
jgi:hypothetical protein